MPFLFAVTLFVSATLLFLVQPMIGKMVLPLLGGSPAVWNTCMVFFQAALLAGYLYAHGLTRRLGPRAQWLLHAGLLLLPLVPLLLLGFDAIGLARSWLPPPQEANPVPWLLALLGLSVGLPFFVVSTSAPLLQEWFARTGHPSGKDPYFLYAASNLGSMLALVGYPTLIEPNLRLGTQGWVWIVGYGVLVLLTFVCGLQMARAQAVGIQPIEVVRTDAGPDGETPSLGRRLRWIALAFVPSSLMLGVTTHITTDVAAIPLLWVIPLALYLLSFILVFAQWSALLDRVIVLALVAVLALYLATFDPTALNHLENLPAFWRGLSFTMRIFTSLALAAGVALFVGLLRLHAYYFPVMSPLLHRSMIVLLPLIVLALAFPPPYQFDLPGRHVEIHALVWQTLLLHFLALFVTAMVCHGELARTRPAPRYLTEFYLCMSVGGVLGGLFNALVAPVAFNKVLEYPLVIVGACLLLPRMGVTARSGPRFRWIEVRLTALLGLFGGVMAIVFLCQTVVTAAIATPLPGWLPGWLRDPAAALVTRFARGSGNIVLHQERNFFGLVRVQEYSNGNDVYHYMVHGTTDHGPQCVEPPERRTQPIAYFHRKGPVGQIFAALHAKQKPSYHMAVLGVGTGTLASYAEKGWSLTLYEIDPAVVRLARDPHYFTYLTDCEKRGVNLDVILGDGRLQLAKAPAGGYDVLFMDAFTSDAVPVHLITREAIELYKTKLAPDGILVVNIANRYIDFKPVMGNLAAATGLVAVGAPDQPDLKISKYGSHWVVLGRDRQALGTLVDARREDGDEKGELWFNSLPPHPGQAVWTDDFSNIVQVFFWKR